MKYDYRCKNDDCGVERTVDHKISEDPRVTCDECGEECKRLITGGTGFVLKGKGWYNNGGY